jgi:hypothetical protein
MIHRFAFYLLWNAVVGLCLCSLCYGQNTESNPSPKVTPSSTQTDNQKSTPETSINTSAPAVSPASQAPPGSAGAPAVSEKPGETKPAEEIGRVARLVCYREKKFVGSALHHTIYLDGEEIGDLNNGTYFIINAAPGEHKMHADEEKDVFSFTVEAGKTYYFRTALQMGFWKGHGKIEPVEAQYGAQEFAKWKEKGELKYSPDLKKEDILEKPDVKDN